MILALSHNSEFEDISFYIVKEMSYVLLLSFPFKSSVQLTFIESLLCPDTGLVILSKSTSSSLPSAVGLPALYPLVKSE